MTVLGNVKRRLTKGRLEGERDRDLWRNLRRRVRGCGLSSSDSPLLSCANSRPLAQWPGEGRIKADQIESSRAGNDSRSLSSQALKDGEGERILSEEPRRRGALAPKQNSARVSRRRVGNDAILLAIGVL
jgi:hypothetical protein